MNLWQDIRYGERAIQALVSPNFFTTLGVQPVLGRGFQEGEDQPGREREVVLSDRLWRGRFAADPTIVGQNIRLDDQNFLVTGAAGKILDVHDRNLPIMTISCH